MIYNRPVRFQKKTNRRSKKSALRDRLRNTFACCKNGKKSDTGLYSRGHHTHIYLDHGPIDHATGYGFRKDESTTKAVFLQMKGLGVI